LLRNRGVTLALLSNWDARGPELLKNLKLEPEFSVRVFSSDVGYEKPEPDIFDQVLKRFDKSFKRILMIGNHVEIDLEEPDCRGWETLLFTPGSEDEWPRKVSGWEDVPDEIFISNP
jgi:HAD superfamily hydrolase (TIGR01549 family)